MGAFESFLAMGGYAAFVWPAYGVALAVLAGLLLQSRRRFKAEARTLAGLEAARPERRRAVRETSQARRSNA